MQMIELKKIIQKTKKLKVLYVEDNAETRNQSVKMFQNFFDYIDIAEDGAIGLKLYKSKDLAFYDLVISDINMPNINGLDMSKSILDINPNQYILIITAHNDPQNLELFLDLGISNYINKPIKMDTILKAIQKTIKELN